MLSEVHNEAVNRQWHENRCWVAVSILGRNAITTKPLDTCLFAKGQVALKTYKILVFMQCAIWNSKCQANTKTAHQGSLKYDSTGSDCVNHHGDWFIVNMWRLSKHIFIIQAS